MTRISIGIPEVFRWSVGDTTEAVADGWRGVVKINYAEGWIDVDTFYRWTRAERMASAGVLGRLLVWLGD